MTTCQKVSPFNTTYIHIATTSMNTCKLCMCKLHYLASIYSYSAYSSAVYINFTTRVHASINVHALHACMCPYNLKVYIYTNLLVLFSYCSQLAMQYNLINEMLEESLMLKLYNLPLP